MLHIELGINLNELNFFKDSECMRSVNLPQGAIVITRMNE